MTFAEIVSFCCSKVQKQDPASQAACLTFVLKRHREIYQSYNWHAAQVIVNKTTLPNQTVTQMDVPEVSHCLSVTVNDNVLQHATTSYVYETMRGSGLNTPGQPLAYDEFYSPSDQHPIIRFWPAMIADPVNGYSVSILGKAPLPADNILLGTIIPHTAEVLIAYTLGDMWEYMNQLGKAPVKFQEASVLLARAQAADTPIDEPRIIPDVAACYGSSNLSGTGRLFEDEWF